MAMLAMWFQETYTFSSGNAKLLMAFIALVAVSMFVQAIVTISVSLKAAKAMKDLAATAEEFKTKALPLITKALPLIDAAMDMGHTAHTLLNETAPKVKLITDNLVETTNVVRHSAQEFDRTIADANMRTQRQVARVDGMVTAALTTTAEIVETVGNGIRGPVKKIAEIASQAKSAVEGVVARMKSAAAKSPFANR
jgi:methyl-accepting chemotaxis protein